MSRKPIAVNHEVMHRINRSLVLSTLRGNPSQTRARISDRTGLTRSAISNLTDELIQNEMIHEVGLEESTGGRRGILLELNPDGACAIAVKFNASSVQCALANLVGNIIWHELVPIHSTEESSVLGICERMIDTALAQNDCLRPVLGIGVAAPGLISAEGDMIYSKFLNWRDVKFRDRWQDRYGVPVCVDNLVSLAALGENHFGSAINDSHFMFIEIGYGAGAGIVIDSQLYQGKNGFAGEIGYMVLSPDAEHERSPLDWQSLVNIPRFKKIVRRQIEEQSDSSPYTDSLSFSRLLDSLKNGDQVAWDAMSEMSRYLGMAIANLCNAFDIPVFILGGELGKAYAPFLSQIRGEIEGHLVVMPPSGIDVRISDLQPDAALMGAVARVFDTRLIEPSLHAVF